MIEIVEKTWEAIRDYERVSIAFSGESELDPDALRNGELQEVPCEPFEKDYDQLEPPPSLAERYPVDRWRILVAVDGPEIVGGLILALNREDYDADFLLDGDACIVDIRVALMHRGVGRALVENAAQFAKTAGKTAIKVETQNNNVAACRFYQAVGFGVDRVDEGAYAELPREERVIWRKALLPIQ